MRTILVTGSAGLVGSACASLFKEKGWRVVGVDNNMRSQLFGTPEQRVDYCIDIRSKEGMESLFRQFAFDAIIHAAGQPSHDWAKNDPLTDFDINARSTLILLELAREYCPNAAIVHVSTDKVYGENMDWHKVSTWPRVTYSLMLKERDTRYEVRKTEDEAFRGFREDLELDFAGQRSLFGCSKTAADIYAQEYANYFGMKVGIFRPGCITGRNHQGAEYHGFLAYLVHCIKNKKPYTIFGYKGKQVRDQIHAYDLANAFYHYIENPRAGEVYNIGGGPGRSLSILEAIHAIEEWLSVKAITEMGEARKGDRIWDVHDVTKFKTHYPAWDYEYSLTDIIRDVCSQ